MFDFLFNSLLFLADLFVLFLGLGVVVVAVLYVRDVTQTKQAIRHNYPVIGRLRYFFRTPWCFLSPILFRHGPGGDAL